MSTCTEGTYVMCDLDGVPSGDVITVQTVPEPLPPTGLNGGDAILIGLIGALALVIGAGLLAMKRGVR